MKAAIFDFDGTLVNSLIFWEIYWRAFGKRYLGVENFVPTQTVDKAVRTAHITVAAKIIGDVYGHEKEAGDLFNEMLDDFYATQVQTKDGVREFLQYCADNGIKMCVATASDANAVRTTMKRLGIDHYFLGVFSCFDLNVGKDSPAVFFKALECLGTAIAETVVFEDSLLAIQTASKAGFPTVGIYDPNNFGHDEMQRIATAYIGDGETMMKLVKQGV